MNNGSTFARSSLWLCADVAALDGASLVRRCEAVIVRAARSGLPASKLSVWLRSSSALSSRAALDLARAMRAMTLAHHTHLVIGERADLALLSNADAVHVTHAGPSVRDVELVLLAGDERAVAMTAAVHDSAEARALADRCAVLVAAPFGHVAQKNAALGVAGLSSIVRAAPARSVIALGAVDDPAAVHAVFAAGARGVAVRRALLSDDPASSMAPLLGALATYIA